MREATIMRKQEKEESRMSRLFKMYNFPFSAPREGTPVEKRLIDACEAYTKFLLNPDLSGAKGSDSHRRKLHNEIAMMVMGEARSNLDEDTAMHIGDFACRVTTGMSLKTAISDMEKEGKFGRR